MKIIYLIAGTYRPAGMERVLSAKANGLAAAGYEVVIVTTDQRGRRSAFPLDSSIRCMDLGINYEENNGKAFIDKALKYPIKLLRHRRRLEKLLKKEKADIVVSMFCNDASFLPLIHDGSRKVLEVHFSRFKRLQYGRKGLWAMADRIRCRLDGKTASRFDRFVVLTDEDRDYWGNLHNITTIPNARTFSPAEVPLLEKDRTVIAAGRLESQKGFDRLLHSWAEVPQSLKDEGWKLKIYGDGSQRGALQDLAAALGIWRSVEFIPGCKDMIREYASASIYAMTSRYEGLPMVLLEAQAAGLPIVAMECKCGPKDIVSEGIDGFITPDGDTAAFAARLSELMQSRSLREDMGASAVKASERFDSKRIMTMWQHLFKDLASRRESLVVSAVNLRKGGTLAILRQCLEYLSTHSGDRRITALVHDRSLCDFPGIEYIELPWCTRSWAHRLWAEYVTMHRISKRLASENGAPVDLWLSLHDTTPDVIAKRQEVYCHTSFPFLKIRPHDFLMDPKIPLFAILGRIYFRINVHRNCRIIVQQQWYAQAMSHMLNIPIGRFTVIAPTEGAGAIFGENHTCQDRELVKAGPAAPCREEGRRKAVAGFLYASTADCHKNFETLCRAAQILENKGYKFSVTITVKGDENRYAKWLFRNWGNVRSIDFHGFMTKGELAKAYCDASCLIFPSRVETWGLPISEYMQTNPEGSLLLPDLPYAKETSGGKAAFFPVCDAEALAKLMSEHIRNYENSATR